MAHLNIALIGGSFNPVHNGHQKMACTLVKEHHVDEVWFVVAKHAPLKEAPLVSFEHRVAMVNLLASKHPRIKVCTIENDLPTPSYTIDTIKALQSRYDHNFSWVIGSDQALQFDAWKDTDELLKMCQFYVFKRNGFEISDDRFTSIDYVSTTSSTDIRHGLSNDTILEVLHYMIDHHLYDQSILLSHINRTRLAHVQSVKLTAFQLAQGHDVDVDKLEVAAMFHDIAKDWPDQKAYQWLEKEGIIGSMIPEYQLHAYASASYMKHYYHYDDKEVYDAIFNHVSGTSEALMAKIIFVADKIEPTRSYDTSEHIDLACRDLDAAYQKVKLENKAYNIKE